MSRKKSPYDKIICKKIKELRLKLKQTGSKFANNVGISQGYLSDIENCKAIPNKTTLLAISYIYNLDINRFLREDVKEMQIAEEVSIYKVENEDPELIELLDKTRKILKSGNQVAYDALERNIRYFDHAIETEKRLKIMESRLEVLEKRLPRKPEDENTEKKVM